MDRLAPALRPAGAPVGTQKWRSLLFLHWQVPVDALRARVPRRLELDLYEERAYVGLVAFEMHDIRPSRWLPPIPTASRFDEVNVRTYVHAGGRDPGVWFLSLDASSALAVLGARALYHLPYFWARIHTERPADAKAGVRVSYRSERRWESDARAALDVRYELGQDIGPATPGTFEHFLAERYYLYAVTAGDQLLRGQVHHTPYPLRRARVVEMKEESLVAAAGIDRPEERASTLWSPGVDVSIHGLEPVREESRQGAGDAR